MPEFLVIGHASKDLLPGGFRVGGTVTYAGLLGLRAGVRTGVVSSYARNLPVQEILGGAQLHVRESSSSTTFQNMYQGSHRTQIISGQAEMLRAEDVPPSWRDSSVVLLGPVARELSPDLFDTFPNSLLALTPQGMMRGWNSEGEVFPVPWDPSDSLLRRLDVVVLSEDDLLAPSQLDRYTDLVHIVAVTHAEEGATLYVGGQAMRFDASPSVPTDPTGAGDVFAAAFLLELHGSGDVAAAARYANAAAALVIEHDGPSGVPTRAQVLQRLAVSVSS